MLEPSVIESGLRIIATTPSLSDREEIDANYRGGLRVVILLVTFPTEQLIARS